MAAQTDRIERDVLIAAPVERVWELRVEAVEPAQPAAAFDSPTTGWDAEQADLSRYAAVSPARR